MKITVICLLDKEYPPEHSFVDGMLAHELPLSGSLEVMLVVSKGTGKKKVLRYGKAVCFPLLGARKGFSRFFNFFLLIPFLIKLIRRKRGRGDRVTLFVRNEPVYLLVACLLQNHVDRIVFQQSFPHEQGSSFSIKKAMAVLIFKATAKFVNALVAVSSLGLERLRRYFGSRPEGVIIPLLGYKEERLSKGTQLPSPALGEPVRFVYTGTHNEARRLEVVLRAIVKAYHMGAKATFDFIGGESRDIERLRRVQGVNELEEKGIIRFIKKISRKKLLMKLQNYHIGLCLIPPIPLFREASPTKLTEYMCRGLAVLASKGIPLQEQFVQDSGGGLLVEWSEESIINGIFKLVSGGSEIGKLRENALLYAYQELDYQKHLQALRYIL